MKPVLCSRRRPKFTLATLTVFLLPGCLSGAAQVPPATSGPGSALSIPKSVLMQPEELVPLLHADAAHKPLIFQVGSHVLYTEAHVPGALYEGPGSQPTGLQSLHKKVASLSRNQFIVLYCGCCPWIHCPNISPAFQELHTMGFTNVKVLYLPNNFGTDWATKGYPVE